MIIFEFACLIENKHIMFPCNTYNALNVLKGLVCTMVTYRKLLFHLPISKEQISHDPPICHCRQMISYSHYEPS